MTATALKDTSTSAVVQYNGFSFGDANSTPPTYRLHGEPVYDDATRVVTHVRYILELSTLIYADQESDTATWVQQARERLSRPGRRLELRELGLGDTTVDSSGSHPDVLWGARPQTVAFTPIGGTLVWQLDWKCEFNVSEPGSAGQSNWLAFNLAMEYSVDEQGFTTRTARGYVQIPQRRTSGGGSSGGRSLNDVRRRVRIRVPALFRRLRSTWRESTDRTRLDFEVVDEQLRTGPFPPGIVDGKVDYQLENAGGDFSWTKAVVEGWLESAPDTPRSTALLQLLAIAGDRAARLAASSGRQTVIPTRIRIRQELFGRRAHLYCEYRTAACVTTLLSAAGIWSPVPGADYRRWRTSVERLWSNHGQVNVGSRAGDDLIIDLVDNPIRQADVGRSSGGAPASASEIGKLPTWSFAPPGNAWLEYNVRLRAHRQENISRHVLSRDVKSSTNKSSAGLGSPFQSSGSGPGILHEIHGEPDQQITLEGEAVRLGVRPTAPVLTSVGGRRLLERERTEEIEQHGTYCGAPALRLRWSVTYDVCGYVGSITPPNNDTTAAAQHSKLTL